MASVSNGGHVTLGVKSGGCAGFEYIWGLSTDDGIEHVKWSDPIEDVLIIDPMAEMFIIGSQIDYVNELGGSYLKIVNPMQTSMQASVIVIVVLRPSSVNACCLA